VVRRPPLLAPRPRVRRGQNRSQSEIDQAMKPIRTFFTALLLAPLAAFSAPRDDTARASCGNGAKRKLLSLRHQSAQKAIETRSTPSGAWGRAPHDDGARCGNGAKSEFASLINPHAV
jgi:hypothetical protein